MRDLTRIGKENNALDPFHDCNNQFHQVAAKSCIKSDVSHARLHTDACAARITASVCVERFFKGHAFVQAQMMQLAEAWLSLEARPCWHTYKKPWLPGHTLYRLHKGWPARLLSGPSITADEGRSAWERSGDDCSGGVISWWSDQSVKRKLICNCF